MVRNYKRKTEDRWSTEDLIEAITIVKERQVKINTVAAQFGISRATLYRHYHKVVLAGAKLDISQFRTCGGNPILTKAEEYVLEKTIVDLRCQGFSVTGNDTRRMCYEYCYSNRIPNQFNPEIRLASHDWYYGFIKRHPLAHAVCNDKNTTRTSKCSNSGKLSKRAKVSVKKKQVSEATAATIEREPDGEEIAIVETEASDEVMDEARDAEFDSN